MTDAPRSPSRPDGPPAAACAGMLLSVVPGADCCDGACMLCAGAPPIGLPCASVRLRRHLAEAHSHASGRAERLQLAGVAYDIRILSPTSP